MDGLMEVQASTKKKQGWVKVAIPDELNGHLMKASCGIEVPVKGLVIAYYDPEEKVENTKSIVKLQSAMDHIDDVVGKCDEQCREDHLQLKEWLSELMAIKRGRE